ncbi:MAG: STT3 domain-containing protein [Candidatus Omnitrophota bacterium]
MKKYLFAALILIPILFINIYLRLFPAYFPQLKDQAKNMIQLRIRQQAALDVESKFTNFSPVAKDRLLNNLVRDIKRTNKKAIRDQERVEYLKLKDKYQGDDNQTYLMELDCWHWARYVDNVLRLGHPGDKVVDGRQQDILMLAPEGSFLAWDNFIYYASAVLYKIFSFFNPLPLFNFLFYLPILYIALFIIALYLFAFSLGGNIAGAIACLSVGLTPIFLPRSCAGWFDKDILNLLLPLLTIWAYALAYSHSSFNLKRKISWICFSSFWVGLFSFTWTYWWFIFLIIIIYELFSLLYYLVKAFILSKDANMDVFKEHLISLSLFLIFSAIWVFFMSGSSPFVFVYSQVINALILNKSLSVSIWPNVFSTVGELRKVGLVEIGRSAGGMLVFIPSLICLVLAPLFYNKYNTYRRETLIILIIWFLSMAFACLKGVRFVMFITLPLGIFLGWGASEIYGYFKLKKKPVISILLMFVVIFLSADLVRNGIKTAKKIYPLIDDIWYRSLNVIRENTPPESILNSWWDFGDWFKVVAGRRVIFDGQSQDAPQVYWMARVFLSNSEAEAIAILRMLNNAGNKAFDIINSELKDPYKSIFILQKILLTERAAAIEILSKYLPLPKTEEVASILFSSPGKAYFIVDPTMPSKMHAISYIGNWNFARVYLAQNLKKKSKERIISYLIKLGVQDAERLYAEVSIIQDKSLDDWISKRFQFFSGVVKGEMKDNIVYFNNGFIYNPKEQSIYLYNPREGKYKSPQSIFIMQPDNSLTEVTCPNATLGFSVLIFKNADGVYQSILLSREIANSIFVRLFIFNGAGLKHFKLFMEGLYGREEDGIRVFKIKWD